MRLAKLALACAPPETTIFFQDGECSEKYLDARHQSVPDCKIVLSMDCISVNGLPFAV